MQPWQTTVNHLLLATVYEPDDNSEENDLIEEAQQIVPSVEPPPSMLCHSLAISREFFALSMSPDANAMYRSGNSSAPVITRCTFIPPIDITALLDSDKILHVKVKRVDSPDTIYAAPIHPDTARVRADAQEFNVFSRQMTEFYNDAGAPVALVATVPSQRHPFSSQPPADRARVERGDVRRGEAARRGRRGVVARLLPLRRALQPPAAPPGRPAAQHAHVGHPPGPAPPPALRRLGHRGDQPTRRQRLPPGRPVVPALFHVTRSRTNLLCRCQVRQLPVPRQAPHPVRHPARHRGLQHAVWPVVPRSNRLPEALHELRGADEGAGDAGRQASGARVGDAAGNGKQLVYLQRPVRRGAVQHGRQQPHCDREQRAGQGQAGAHRHRLCESERGSAGRAGPAPPAAARHR